MPELDDLLALLEASVRDAGKIARGYFGGEFKRWDKSKGNPVTEADIEIDGFLKKTLRAARPDFGWLSEETEDDAARLATESQFVVDPIDGTIAFMKGRPYFTICAGVVTGGTPVAGAVYNPISEECFTARLGGGAFLNGAAIHVSDRAEIEGCRMLADKAMLAHPAWDTPPNRPWPAMDIETRSSIAYRMVLVAAGQFDAALALSSKRDWDLAAAQIVVTEAGGMVTSHDGSLPRYNRVDAVQPSIVCAGPALHAKLIERISHIKLPRR